MPAGRYAGLLYVSGGSAIDRVALLGQSASYGRSGFPGYGEVDFDASMALPALRQRYPHLVLWANVSGDLLRRGTLAQVREHCQVIVDAAEGDGYLHGCSNTILAGTPPDNVWAMIEASQ